MRPSKRIPYDHRRMTTDPKTMITYHDELPYAVFSNNQYYHVATYIMEYSVIMYEMDSKGWQTGKPITVSSHYSYDAALKECTRLNRLWYYARHPELP